MDQPGWHLLFVAQMAAQELAIDHDAIDQAIGEAQAMP
jgi:hypothetical protein